jgi:ribosome-associated translation inhibitor RaiA
MCWFRMIGDTFQSVTHLLDGYTHSVALDDWGCYALERCTATGGTGFPSFFSDFPTGVDMKLSISYKNVESHKPVEVEVERQVRKLEKLLKSYSPDLLQMHGAFTKNPRTDEITFALNLSMPGGTLHAAGTAAKLRTSLKKSFSELEAQVKKHQEKLRKDYEWKRKRPRVRVEALS